MTKSKMRIYGGNRYSEHEADLKMSIDQDGNTYLLADYLFHKTWVEHIRIPADDVIAALWPRVLECVDDALNDALFEVLKNEG